MDSPLGWARTWAAEWVSKRAPRARRRAMRTHPRSGPTAAAADAYPARLRRSLLASTLPARPSAPRRASQSRPRSAKLLERHRRRLASAGELPSLKEIELLLKLEREIEADETLERPNALSRELG